MKKLLIILLLTSLTSSPAYGMWSAWTTRLASGTQFARKQMAALAKSAPKVTLGAAKTIQKPIVKVTGNSGNRSNNTSNWWDRISKGLASAWNTLKQNMKLPQWLTNSAAKEQIKKTLKTHVQKLGTRAPMIGGALAAAGIQTAHAQGKQPEMPAFTVENIFNYRLYPQHRSAFIAHAIHNIATKDEKTIEAIQFLITRYPEAVEALTTAAIKEFANVHPLILKDILLYNPQAAKQYMHALLETENPHFHDVFNDSGLKGSVLWKPEYVWRFGSQPNEESFSLSRYIIDQVIQNPQSVSVKAYNKLYARTRIGDWHSSSIQLAKAAIQHYGQDAKTMILIYKGGLKYSDITEKPKCVYVDPNDEIPAFYLAQAVIHEIRSVSLDDVTYVYGELEKIKNSWYPRYTYYDYLKANEKMEEVRNAAIAHFDTKNISDPFKVMENPLFKDVPPIYQTNVLHAAMQGYDGNVPSFLLHCSQDNHQATHSEKHFCLNMQSVMNHIFKQHDVKQKTNSIALFKRALHKERQELAKGNHVFYHGRKWEWDFVSDMYKELHNVTKDPMEQVGNDYTFLRFDNSKSVYAGKADGLFLNAPLFGSTKWWGNSTSQLILNNYDWSRGKWTEYTPKKFFAQFGLTSHYAKYKAELDTLRLLHKKANPSNIGSLLMISVDDKQVERIYSARTYVDNKRPITLSTGESTLDTRRILGELKAGKLPGGGDDIEYILPLGQDYALNPQKGPRIYSLNACDPAKYKEYTDYRDQLFARIKTDIDNNGALS